MKMCGAIVQGIMRVAITLITGTPTLSVMHDSIM